MRPHLDALASHIGVQPACEALRVPRSIELHSMIDGRVPDPLPSMFDLSGKSQAALKTRASGGGERRRGAGEPLAARDANAFLAVVEAEHEAADNQTIFSCATGQRMKVGPPTRSPPGRRRRSG